VFRVDLAMTVSVARGALTTDRVHARRAVRYAARVKRPVAQTVNLVRGVATWAVRAVSVGLMVFGAYLLLARVAWALGNTFSLQNFAFYSEPHEVGAPFIGVSMLVVGTALGGLSAHIARWMIPVPPESCPRCGFAEPTGARCSECGLELEG
jgi:hypothetical protein